MTNLGRDQLFHGLVKGWRTVLVLLAFSWCLPAYAALGGQLDSVISDQLRMKADLEVFSTRAYAVHQLRAAGVVVREYVSPSGQVFGVAWEGPFVPQMDLLLGTYFEQYCHGAKTQRESHVGRRPLNIQDPGLVVQTAGHMGAYSGWAYDPRLLPKGTNADDIR